MLETFSLNKYNDALSRGLCKGKGSQVGQMCIEAAICYAFGLPHGDDPQCVSYAVRCFKINLNDSDWSSPKARAEGLRDLGLAQLGSLGIIDDVVFAQQLALATINKLIPTLFRELFPDNEKLLQLALQCENAVDLVKAEAASASASASDAAEALANARYAASDAAEALANARYAASDAAYAAAANVASAATYANANVHSSTYAQHSAANVASAATYANVANAANANAAKNDPDKYLIMSANIALDILIELNSPGCQFLTR